MREKDQYQLLKEVCHPNKLEGCKKHSLNTVEKFIVCMCVIFLSAPKSKFLNQRVNKEAFFIYHCVRMYYLFEEDPFYLPMA